jgi:hypothetical protein
MSQGRHITKAKCHFFKDDSLSQVLHALPSRSSVAKTKREPWPACGQPPSGAQGGPALLQMLQEMRGTRLAGRAGWQGGRPPQPHGHMLAAGPRLRQQGGLLSAPASRAACSPLSPVQWPSPWALHARAWRSWLS